MVTRRKSGSKSLLLELMLDIVIFALCAAVCVQIFALSESTMLKSRAMTFFNIETQALISTFKSENGDIAKTAELTEGSQNKDGFVVYYDKSLKKIGAADGAEFQIRCTSVDLAADVSTIDLEVFKQEESLIKFTVSKCVLGV